MRKIGYRQREKVSGKIEETEKQRVKTKKLN